MTNKPKNDNKSLLRRNALILSIGLNVVLITMFLILYVPSLAPPPPPIPDAFQLSSTALIEIATGYARTQMAGTPSPEPIPTLSAEDEAVLRNQFLNELETELGFLHPVLEATVEELIASINLTIPNNLYGYNALIPDNIINEIDSMTFDDVEYKAVTIPYRVGWAEATRGLIFRIENDSPELLAQSNQGTSIENFDDRNGNTFPDIVFRISTASDSSIIIYEIRPNNEFVNLSANLNASIKYFVDLENDGIMELYGTQQLFIPESVQENNKYPPEVPRWFRWNGEAYEALPLIEGE